MPRGYSALQIALHWVIALLIAAQFLFHDGISAAFDQLVRGQVPAFSWLVWGHIAGGIAILALVLWRISVRLSRGAPEAPTGTPALLHRAGALGHLVLYALMLALPISGLIAWFGRVDAAGGAHEVMTNLLLLVVALHVLAALYHQYIRKDRLLLRMMRPQ